MHLFRGDFAAMPGPVTPGQAVAAPAAGSAPVQHQFNKSSATVWQQF
jgi:hypothetical protein